MSNIVSHCQNLKILNVKISKTIIVKCNNLFYQNPNSPYRDGEKWNQKLRSPLFVELGEGIFYFLSQIPRFIVQLSFPTLIPI